MPAEHKIALFFADNHAKSNGYMQDLNKTMAAVSAVMILCCKNCP